MKLAIDIAVVIIIFMGLYLAHIAYMETHNPHWTPFIIYIIGYTAKFLVEIIDILKRTQQNG